MQKSDLNQPATKGDLQVTKVDLAAVKNDVQAIKVDLAGVKSGIKAMREDLSNVRVAAGIHGLARGGMSSRKAGKRSL